MKLTHTSKLTGVRDVYVELEHGTWFVRYVKRNFGQRYLAAQFNARYYGEEIAKEWVSKNPKLRLVPKP